MIWFENINIVIFNRIFHRETRDAEFRRLLWEGSIKRIENLFDKSSLYLCVSGLGG